MFSVLYDDMPHATGNWLNKSRLKFLKPMLLAMLVALVSCSLGVDLYIFLYLFNKYDRNGL